MYDMKKLKLTKKVSELAPDGFKAFQAFDKAALADGAIPVKYKELIAVGVALSTQCAYCLEVHRRAAVKAGATEAELAETALVAAALRAGGAIAHSGHLMPEEPAAS